MGKITQAPNTSAKSSAGTFTRADLGQARLGQRDSPPAASNLTIIVTIKSEGPSSQLPNRRPRTLRRARPGLDGLRPHTGIKHPGRARRHNFRSGDLGPFGDSGVKQTTGRITRPCFPPPPINGVVGMHPTSLPERLRPFISESDRPFPPPAVGLVRDLPLSLRDAAPSKGRVLNARI